MSEIIKCSNCSESLAIPTFDAFKVKCVCETVYERSKPHEDIFFEVPDTNKQSTSIYDKVGNGLTTFLLAAIPITLIICALMFAGSKLFSNESEQQSVLSTPAQDDSPILSSSGASTAEVIIYSGTCTNFKKEIIGNQMKYTKVSKAFGKVVIDRLNKKFSFYYDNRLIYSSDDYLSYVDGQQGGEGFTLSDGYSAHSLPAEKTFHIYHNPITGEAGNEYRITDYKVD